MLDTYGPAINELIHEKGGNGIMSAVDFAVDADIIPDEHGVRVVITWNGKLRKYSKMGDYPCQSGPFDDDPEAECGLEQVIGSSAGCSFQYKFRRALRLCIEYVVHEESSKNFDIIIRCTVSIVLR